ncbi:hypothetical protein C8Q74DRAFT_1222884 [Fomes fomentarius]|nr:hypothetical protein C8Q74DRAFT_1222884 [Fomes fomentarius]
MADSLLFEDYNTLIQYGDQWRGPVDIVIPGETATYDAHCTPEGGDSSFKFSYEFSGAQVWAFYREEGLGIRVTCTVDGKNLVVNKAPQISGSYTPWMICNTEQLPQQNHTVEITVTGDHDEDFCFDRISVQTTPQLSSALQNSTSMPQPTASSAPAPSRPQSHLGAIIGGTLGGVAFILLCGGLFFLWTRIRGQQKYSSMDDDEDGMHPHELESPGYLTVEARPPTSHLTLERKSTSLSEKSFYGAGPARDPTARPEDLVNIVDAVGHENAPSHFVQSPQSRASSPPRGSSHRPSLPP